VSVSLGVVTQLQTRAHIAGRMNADPDPEDRAKPLHFIKKKWWGLAQTPRSNLESMRPAMWAQVVSHKYGERQGNSLALL
jgi:hypothetical protein